jgi:hypothetical protein
MGKQHVPMPAEQGGLGGVLARLHQFEDRFKPHNYVSCFQELLPPVDPDREQRRDRIR